jgi:hypothetical protein
MLAPVLALVTLVGQSSPTSPADIIVRPNDTEIVVTVYPHGSRIVRAITLHPGQTKGRIGQKALRPRPRSTESRADNGVRVSFDRPATPAFRIAVTFDDNSVYRVEYELSKRQGPPGSYTVRPLLGDPPKLLPPGTAKG